MNRQLRILIGQGIIVVVAACSTMTNPKTVLDTGIAVKDALCLFDVYSTEVQAGKDSEPAIVDAASKCNIATDIAQMFLRGHKAALEREMRKP